MTPKLPKLPSISLEELNNRSQIQRMVNSLSDEQLHSAGFETIRSAPKPGFKQKLLRGFTKLVPGKLPFGLEFRQETMLGVAPELSLPTEQRLPFSAKTRTQPGGIPKLFNLIGRAPFSLAESIIGSGISFGLDAVTGAEAALTGGKTQRSTVPIDMRRFGFEEEQFETAMLETAERIAAGDNPIGAASFVAGKRSLRGILSAMLFKNVVGGVSNKLSGATYKSKVAAYEVLKKPNNVAQAKATIKEQKKILRQMANKNQITWDSYSKSSEMYNSALKVYTKNGIPNSYEIASTHLPERVSAWELLGKPKTVSKLKNNYRVMAHKLHPDKVGLTPATKAQWDSVQSANNVLKQWGLPNTSEVAEFKVSRGLDILTRESPSITQAFKGGLDIVPPKQEGIQQLSRPALPGTRPVPGQPRPLGLSIQEVERVGGPYVANKAKNATDLVTFNKSLSVVDKANIKAAGLTSNQVFKAAQTTKDVLPTQTAKLAQLKQNPDFERVDAELSTIIELSEPGYRIFSGFGSDLEVSGASSTFPQWIPENLRSKSLMQKAYGHIENNTIPSVNATRERELYDVFVDYIDSNIKPMLPSEMESLQQIADQQLGPVASGLEVPTPQTIGKRPPTVQKILGQQTKDITRKETTLLRERILNQARGARIATRVLKKANAAIRAEEISAMQRDKQISLLRQRIKDRFTFLERGKRTGALEMKKEIAAVQSEVKGYINQFLPLADRGRFINKLAEIKTYSQLEKKLPVVLDKIDEILGNREIAQIRSQIKSELAKKDESVKGGLVKGRLTPEAKTKLDNIRQYTNMTKREAEARLEGLLEQLDNVDSIDSDAIAGIVSEINLLKYKTGELDLETSKKLLEEIKSIRETGKTLRQVQISNKQAEREAWRDGFVDSITGGKGLKPGTGITQTSADYELTKLQELRKNVGNLEDRMLFANFLFDKISRADVGSQYMESLPNKFWRGATAGRLGEEHSIDVANVILKDKLIEIFDIKPNTRKWRSFFKDYMDKPVNIGTFKDLAGRPFEFITTENRLGKMWAHLQDPEQAARFKATFGPNWRDVAEAINLNISPKNRQLAEFLIEDFYPDFRYGLIDGIPLDPIYEKIYGSTLEVLPNYMPLNLVGGGTEEVELLKQSINRSSAVPSAIKRRTKNLKPFNLESGLLDTASNHIVQIAHFKGFGEFLNDAKYLWNDTDVVSALNQNFTDAKTIRQVINNLLDDTARNGIAAAKKIDLIDIGRSNVASAFLGNPLLGGNVPSAAKQAVSMINWAAEMPIADFTSGLVEALTYEPRAKLKFLYENNPWLKQRYNLGGLDRDLMAGLKSGEVSAFLSDSKSLKKTMSVLLRMGDRAGITTGGFGYYKYKLGLYSGVTPPKSVKDLEKFIIEYPEAHKQAMIDFTEVARTTQQEGLVEGLPDAFRMGSYGNILTMFGSGPAVQFNNSISVLRAMGFFGDPKRVPTGKGLKKLLIYLVATPALLQLVSDGFKFRPRRQAAAVAGSVLSMGWSNYPVFIGSAIQNSTRAIAGLPFFDQSSPIQSMFDGFPELVESLRDPSVEDVIGTIWEATKLLSTFRGIPIANGEKTVEGAMEFLEGGDFRRIMNWSEWALEDQGAEIPKKPKRGSGLDLPRLPKLDLPGLELPNL